MRTIEEIKADMKEIKSCLPKNYTNTDMLEVEYELREALIYDIPTDRLEEICNAERDGLLVALPCKVGSDVWTLSSDYTECSIHGQKYSDSNCVGCEANVCDSKQTKTIKRIKNVSLLSLGGWIQSKCFGKTIFLTKEEAEQALKGGAE